MKNYDAKSMTFTELSAQLAALSLPAFRATQLFDWLQQKGAMDYGEMTNLPAPLRAQLAQVLPIYGCRILKKQVSALDGTVKYLFALHDGTAVESVLMRYKYGHTLCVSSQAGCKMGCTFCASARSGFVRDLTPSEILSQIHAAQREDGVRVSHVVLMGMGEPLDNYGNVLRFLALVSDSAGLNIGMRNISLSTCGIVPRIYDLMALKLQLTLSVSLHAPNDEIRSRSMPINRRYPLDALLSACRDYANATSRRISFEYAMIQGVNDAPGHAKELSSRLRGMLCHVNLIPVNPITAQDGQPTPRAEIERFAAELQRRGIPATIRRTLGSDIDAACGQLRLHTET